MENNRPLQNLTDEELLSLWNKAIEVDDMGHTTIYHVGSCEGDSLLNEEDIEYIRAGVLLQVKLCDMYGVPHPPIRLDLGEYEPEFLSDPKTLSEDDEEDEYEYEPDLYEYMRENLHITMDAFGCIDGIGDFVEEDLFYAPDVLEALLVDDADEKKKAEAIGWITDEMEYSGYREVLDFVRNVGYDMVDVEEFKVTKSRKMASLMKSVEKRAVPQGVPSFLDKFTRKVFMRTCYWVPMDNLEEIKDDTWCCVHAVLNCLEDGMIVGDLYKNMSIRIGAFIAQEFADRYAA